MEGVVVEGKGSAAQVAGEVCEIAAQLRNRDADVHAVEVEALKDLVLNLLCKLRDLLEVACGPAPQPVVRFREQLLPGRREVAVDTGAAGDPGWRLTESRGHGQRVPPVEEKEGVDAVGLFEWTEILPTEVLLDRDLRGLGIGEL